MKTPEAVRLRVAFLAGTLDRGGAEKQLVYMVRALRDAGVVVRVYTLLSGERMEEDLRCIGVPPIWVGRRSHPLIRTAALARALQSFRPHILQSAHFYTNLYVSAVAPLYGAMAIGAVRGDVYDDIASNGRWGRWLLGVPPSLLANSHAAKRNAEQLGVAPNTVCVVPNAIDVAEFERLTADGPEAPDDVGIVVAAVGTLIGVKRFDRFLRAMALARREVPTLRGILVGDGPERSQLEGLAQDLGLLPDGVQFVGLRRDVAHLLRHHADVLVLTSDHEGFPNVLLEAMAAGLPVITTPAGDAGVVVRDRITGYVVPFDDVEELAERITQLARSPGRRHRLGAAGRSRVAQEYAFEQLGGHLLASYRAFAETHSNRRALAALRRDVHHPRGFAVARTVT